MLDLIDGTDETRDQAEMQKAFQTLSSLIHGFSCSGWMMVLCVCGLVADDVW